MLKIGMIVFIRIERNHEFNNSVLRGEYSRLKLFYL